MAGVVSGGFTEAFGNAVSVRCTGVSGLGGRVAWAGPFYGPMAQGTGHRSRVAGCWVDTDGAAVFHAFVISRLLLLTGTLRFVIFRMYGIPDYRYE